MVLNKKLVLIQMRFGNAFWILFCPSGIAFMPKKTKITHARIREFMVFY